MLVLWTQWRIQGFIFFKKRGGGGVMGTDLGGTIVEGEARLLWDYFHLQHPLVHS